jgi:hypothetical protein
MRRALLVVVLIVVAAGITAPLLNASRFRGQIQSALETALNRRVSIGKVRFTLFTGPGFSVEDVLIDEAPGMGIEPFAHVETLQARIRLSSLWSGKLMFSNLKLSEPSVNFVKSESGPWNIQPLLNRARLVNPDPRAPVPEIQIRDGRLNFKFGNTKSVFYINNADLDVYSNDRGGLIVRFEGEPARTDHAAQGLGHLVARGALQSQPGSDDQLSMSVQLERTSIPELARLFGVQDIGVRGSVASNVKLDGPLSKLNISGDLRIEDIHRWDLMPAKGEGWNLNYTGFWDVPAQKLDIETRSPAQQVSPVNGKFVASDYLTAPQWEASLSLKDLPAADLLETARHMGAPFPAGGTLDGKVNGELGYSRAEGFGGELVLDNASFKFPQGGAIEFATAPVEIKNNAVKLGPAEVKFEGEESARLGAQYAFDSRKFHVDLETKILGIAQTKALVARMLGAGDVTLLDRCPQGNWRGTLAFEQAAEGPGAWTGDFELLNAQMEIPGFAAPLKLASAAVLMQPEQVVLSHIRGHAAAMAFEGDYRYSPGANRPDRMRLFLPEVQLADLERFLLPALTRQQGFLARALRLEAGRTPDWLTARSVDGFVQIKNVKAGDGALGSVRTRLVWTGSNVELAGLESKLDGMVGSGRLVVNLAGASPRYKLTGRLNGVDYHGGTLDLDGILETSGIGTALALNAKSDGSFSGANIVIAADTEVDEMNGDYRVEPSASGPRLTLSRLQIVQGVETLHGQGASQADGHLVLELTTSGRKAVRMSGMLLPLRGVAP